MKPPSLPPRNGWGGALKLAKRSLFPRRDARGSPSSRRQVAAAGADAPLPAPQTHYHWRWRPLCIDSNSRPLVFRFSAGTLAYEEALAQYGILHDPQAPSVLMIVDESEETLALATQVKEALTASPCGLIVVTRRAWRIEENEALSAAHHALWAMLRVAANEQPERLIAAIDMAENASWETLRQGLSAVSLSQRWLAARDNGFWLPSLAPNAGCAAELPAKVFAGDNRWHLVTGAFGGLGRLAVNWLREKGRAASRYWRRAWMRHGGRHSGRGDSRLPL